MTQPTESGINWPEVSATAGIALAVLVAALCLPYVRDGISSLASRTPTTEQ